MELKTVLYNLKTHIAEHSKNIPPVVHSIIAFGSYAKGQQRVGSDIDIAVVLADDVEIDVYERAEIREIFDEFSDDISAELFFTRSNRVISTMDVLDANYSIREEGVPLWTA